MQVKKVMRVYNFRRRILDRMFQKGKEFRYRSYTDLYSKKIIGVALTKNEKDFLEKIEDKSSLAELMYLRKVAIERQIIRNNYSTGKSSEVGQYLGRCMPILISWHWKNECKFSVHMPKYQNCAAGFYSDGHEQRNQWNT